jgi:hypothetical protein
MWSGRRFGGLGLPIEQHTWTDKATGVTRVFSKKIVESLQITSGKTTDADPKGLSPPFTQTTDVESEVNGLMTYDRKYSIRCRRNKKTTSTIIFRKRRKIIFLPISTQTQH